MFLSLILRVGEVCALRWRDIDLSAGILTVRSSVQRIKNIEDGAAKTILLESMPKSRSSLRHIPLPDDLIKKLRRVRNEAIGQGLSGGRKGLSGDNNGLSGGSKGLNKGKQDLTGNSKGLSGDSYVLTGNSKPMEPRTLRARFKVIADKAGLNVSFHALRHSYATRCLEYNFDIQTLSELLGHSNVSVTMKVYAHSVFDHKKQLTGRIRILSERSSEKNSDKALDKRSGKNSGRNSGNNAGKNLGKRSEKNTRKSSKKAARKNSKKKSKKNSHRAANRTSNKTA